MPAYRSKTSTGGRNMAGARALWRATGMKDGDFDKPIIAIANSFTQFVPGHVHLKDLGQLVAREIEAAGGVAKEFNTIAVDDGIAMGHDGMLYSLPSRDIIADSVEYMVNAHCADALVCISNCDKITPGMLMAAMRLNIPVIFVSGGPMEAGKTKLANPTTHTLEFKKLDLVDAMVIAADSNYTDEQVGLQRIQPRHQHLLVTRMQVLQHGAQLGEARGLGLVGQVALGLHFLGVSARLHQHRALQPQHIGDEEHAQQAGQRQHQHAQRRLDIGDAQRHDGWRGQRVPVECRQQRDQGHGDQQRQGSQIHGERPPSAVVKATASVVPQPSCLSCRPTQNRTARQGAARSPAKKKPEPGLRFFMAVVSDLSSSRPAGRGWPGSPACSCPG